MPVSAIHIDSSSSPLRPEIAKSWRRAQMYGVDPAHPNRLSARETDRASRLMTAAKPIVEELANRLSGYSLCLILADRDCRVVGHWSGDRTLRVRLGHRGVDVGIGLDEGTAGTNGLGTALETGQGVSVNGAEHYLHALKGFSCHGHPIRHPLTRRIEGVLDITVEGAASNPLFGPLLERAVRDIEASLIDGARERERRLFHAFQHASRKRSAAVAVLGEDVVLATRSCIDRLGDSSPTALRILLPEVVAKGELSRTLDLGPAGQVYVAAERIEGTADGVVFQLADHQADTARALPARGLVESVQGAVLITGEPGSGRTTAARDEAGTEPAVTLECTDALAGCERAWATRLTELAATHAGVVIIEDLHVLTESVGTVVRRAIGSAPSARFVLTSCPPDELTPPAARVMGRCARRIDLPPLRERAHEMPQLVASMAASARPGRKLVLTARALAALSTYSWPGNLTELAQLVAELTVRPSTGWIDLPDLPVRYRPSARVENLRGRELAERNAIIKALSASAGNKVRAAEHLGISRTTVYRRIRALGIEERPPTGPVDDARRPGVQLCNSRRSDYAESSPHFKARRGT